MANEHVKTNGFKEKLTSAKNWIMKTTNGMAIGLFGTLIIGTIIDLFAKIPGLEQIGVWSGVVSGLMGAGIGLGVAISLKMEGVSLVMAASAGAIGNYAFMWLSSDGDNQWKATLIKDPLSCYLAVVVAILVVKAIMRKKTPVDLILIPFVGIVAAILYSFLLAEWVHFFTVGIGQLVEISFATFPFFFCIVTSVLVGMALTAPISSVAICLAITIGKTPVAAAAALIGCCTQMLGFAVHTAHDNKVGSVLAVGLGTSMLQFKNIIRKPIVWLPTIIASAILGPLAQLFPVNNLPETTIGALSVGGGMGTSGLVGPLNFLGAIGWDSGLTWLLIGLVCILAPIVLVFFLDLLFRKLGWIEKGDFSLTADI